MNPEVTDSYAQAVEANARRLDLVIAAAQEVRLGLLDPLSIDQRADLLLAAEELHRESIILVGLARAIAWKD